MKIVFEKSWQEKLDKEMKLDYFSNLVSFLNEEYKKEEIYPPSDKIFQALNLTKLKNVKVVILGQDPYHGVGQAHGLAFSVMRDIKIPPSLRNIYKELETDLGVETPGHGNLEAWAKQGVLLLNNTLTVKKSQAGSHQKKGWEQFTKKIIEIIDENNKNVVFILWGGPAQKKAAFVNREKHLVIEGPHPSPLSSYRGFFGSRPFSKTNEYLRKHGIKEINWSIN